VGLLPALSRASSSIPATCSPSPRPLASGSSRVAHWLHLPDALTATRTGQRVLFDDGKIGGLVVDVRCGEIDISIVSAAPGGTKLHAEKGINLPDTKLDVTVLGPMTCASCPSLWSALTWWVSPSRSAPTT